MQQRVDCDYYQILAGNPKAMRNWQVIGTYLEEYSWAEETCAALCALTDSFKTKTEISEN